MKHLFNQVAAFLQVTFADFSSWLIFSEKQILSAPIQIIGIVSLLGQTYDVIHSI